MPISTFLGGQAPSQLRGLQWLALSDNGQVGAGTIVDDAGGGGTTSWVYGGTVACRVDPMGANSRVTGGAIDERSTHLVTVPDGTVINATNRFLIAGRGTFEVTAVRSRTGQLTQTFEVISVS